MSFDWADDSYVYMSYICLMVFNCWLAAEVSTADVSSSLTCWSVAGDRNRCYLSSIFKQQLCAISSSSRLHRQAPENASS